MLTILGWESNMQAIEIDFEVFKELTNRRLTEEVTYNDVLRDLLNLSKIKINNDLANGKPWITKKVSFPHGTEFYAHHKGENYYAKVDNGALDLDGKKFDSPSSAAMQITNYPVNGWTFWECKTPGRSTRRLINALRRNL